MAFRLSDLIISGEFHHSRPYCWHGRIVVRGDETPIHVELTGRPCSDLRNRSFAFEVPQNDRLVTESDRKRVKEFANQQIGITGEITAARRDGLYMEWFSQNGRVVADLPGVEIRIIEATEAPEVEGIDFGAAAEAGDRCDDDEECTCVDFSEDDGDDEFDPDELFPTAGSDDAQDEENYGLIPEELTRELERNSRRLDREASGETEDDIRAIEECELMDDLIENGEGEPMMKLFSGMYVPRSAEITTEDEAEAALKPVLKHLALYGVAFDVCEHCSIREAYRILIDEVCAECTVYPEIRGTAWVQHFSTWDFCKACQNKE